MHLPDRRRLNQCVGELNYKYFMFFLASNGAFFWYGAYLIFYVLISDVVQRDLLNATFVNKRTRTVSPKPLPLL